MTSLKTCGIDRHKSRYRTDQRRKNLRWFGNFDIAFVIRVLQRKTERYKFESVYINKLKVPREARGDYERERH